MTMEQVHNEEVSALREHLADMPSLHAANSELRRQVEMLKAECVEKGFEIDRLRLQIKELQHAVAHLARL